MKEGNSASHRPSRRGPSYLHRPIFSRAACRCRLLRRHYRRRRSRFLPYSPRSTPPYPCSCAAPLTSHLNVSLVWAAPVNPYQRSASIATFMLRPEGRLHDILSYCYHHRGPVCPHFSAKATGPNQMLVPESADSRKLLRVFDAEGQRSPEHVAVCPHAMHVLCSTVLVCSNWMCVVLELTAGHHRSAV